MNEPKASWRRALEEDPCPRSAVVRYVIGAFLRRLAVSGEAPQMVLRGGALMQSWVGPTRRSTKDLDFLGLFPLEPNEVAQRLARVLTTWVEPDGVNLDLQSLVGEVIWKETAFPGLRYQLGANVYGEVVPLQVDFGFGDPLVPEAVWVDYPCLLGSTVKVLAVRPELLAAWKLDGLIDHGAKRWQAKDIYDLYLLGRFCHLDGEFLGRAVDVALATHGNSLEALVELLYDTHWWRTEAAVVRWSKFRAAATTDMPEDLSAVVQRVGAAMGPVLNGLRARRRQ